MKEDKTVVVGVIEELFFKRFTKVVETRDTLRPLSMNRLTV